LDEKVPATQSEQDEAIVCVEYVPAPQSGHVQLLAAKYAPAEQFWQTMLMPS